MIRNIKEAKELILNNFKKEELEKWLGDVEVNDVIRKVAKEHPKQLNQRAKAYLILARKELQKSNIMESEAYAHI